MKSKVVALVSESCGGKDSIAKALVEKYGWNFAVSLTTRPRRETETEGIEYKFVDNDKFDELFENGDMFEKTEYNPDGKRWQYGLSRDCFKDDVTNVSIINPHGMKQLIESDLKDRLIIFKIDCSLEQRIMRYLDRDVIENSHKVQLVDRIVKDIEDFKTFKKDYDCHVLKNSDGMDVNQLCRIIKNAVEGEY